MDQQYSQQIEQQLRSQWDTLLPQILINEFPTVTATDLNSARSVDDLVSRIADKSHYSERHVETRIAQLVGVGGQGQQGQQFSQSQPFGGTSSGASQPRQQ